MLNILKMIKPWREAASANAPLSLYGFWNEVTAITKGGDPVMVLSVGGVDYESVDSVEQRHAVRRLESAQKTFGEGFHVYQYLFKTNRPEIPFATYGDDVIDTAIDQRRQFFESKRDNLYRVEIFYVITLEGQRSRTGLLAAIKQMPSDFQGGMREFKAQFSSSSMKLLLHKQIEADVQKLE